MRLHGELGRRGVSKFRAGRLLYHAGGAVIVRHRGKKENGVRKRKEKGKREKKKRKNRSVVCIKRVNNLALP
jgi:hypothetical protein